MIKKSTFFTAILLLVTSPPLLAIDFEDAIFPELITSARALAMGNAFVAKVDDSASSFYNPAGLGTVRKLNRHFHLTNFQLETNKGLINQAAGGRVTDASSNIMKGFSLDGTRQLLVENPGVLTHSRFQLMPNLTLRYFSAGFLVKKQNRAMVDDSTGTALFEYAKRFDWGPYASLNLSLFGGVIKFGGTAILLDRHEATGTAPADETIELEDEDYKKGRMINVISGAKLTLPITLLPTFAIKGNNTTNAKFTGRGEAGAPDDIKQSWDGGFSVTPQIGNTTRIHLEINYKDMGGAFDNIATNRKIALGAEIDFSRKMFIRFGYGDGFGSGGIGIKTTALEVDLTTYAVDTTTDEFRGKEDRRFAFSLSAGF